MSGRATAVQTGAELCKVVVSIGQALGLEAREQFRLGRRIWGAERRIDVILTNPLDRRRLGVECKYQGTMGTAEEKVPAIVQDIGAWPIPGLVVFAGEGFSTHMRSFLLGTGKAIHVDDLESWLRLFFGLELLGS